MSNFSLTIHDKHLLQLNSHLFQNDCEQASYIVCGVAYVELDPWDSAPHLKFLSKDVLPITEDVISSTSSSITWSTNSLVNLLKTVSSVETPTVVGIVHSHLHGPAEFSEQDDLNEPELWELAANRNGESTLLLSLVMNSEGRLNGRVWTSKTESYPLRIIRVIGVNDLKIFLSHNFGLAEVPPELHRQMLAFGPALISELRYLRVGIVGCGGTGSPTALMLARLGVGHIALFDKDRVEDSNLNRLHGARRSDVESNALKVDVLKREIDLMGLGTQVVTYPHWISEEVCHTPLKSCDIVFGCTDDDDGRLSLNRLAYIYLIPVFDMGLAIELDEEGTGFRCLDSRITVLVPGNDCLLCRGVINIERARSQSLRRTNPAEYARQKEEAYVLGEGNPNPAVITFTTETATMSINELLHRLHGFRGENGAVAERRRKYALEKDLHSVIKSNPDCSICGSQTLWGIGDIEPFLDRVN